MATGGVSAREVRQTLYDIMRGDRPFEKKARDALRLGAEYLGVEAAYFARVDPEAEFWECLVSVGEDSVVVPDGTALDLKSTYCRHVVGAGNTVALDDVQSEWEDDRAVDKQGHDCYHGTPVYIDGELYGTVCFVNEQSRAAPFTTEETILAEQIARSLEREQELERTHDQLELALSATDTGIWEWNIETNEIHWDETVERLLGLEPGEFDGSFESFADRIHPADFDETRESIQAAAETGERYEAQFRMSHENGELRWVQVRGKVVDDGTRMVGTHRDITERIERTQELTETKQRLEVALKGTDTGVWEWDMETDEVIWTLPMEQVFGVEPGTFEGTFDAFIDRVHPADVPALEAAIDEAVETDGHFETAYRIQRDDGERRWVEGRGEVHKVEDGTKRMVGIVTDITERKESERHLARREHQYRQLVNRLPAAYYAFDEDWTIIYHNEVFSDRMDVSDEELVGENIWETFPDISDSVAEETFREVMQTREPASCEYHNEQRGYWAKLQVYPYEGGIAVVSTDITERKKTLEAILDSAPLVLFALDQDGVITKSRGRGLAKLGFEPDELVGESVFDLYADNQDVRDGLERALNGEEFRTSMNLGSVFFETQYTPVFEDGEQAGVIGVSVDVTKTQRQREQLEFFDSILRHDVLNGMTVIKMRGELLASTLDGDQRSHAETIVKWCDRTTEITKRIQRVVEALTTPHEQLELYPVDVSQLLEQKIDDLQSAYPDAEFVGEFDEGIEVRADELLADVFGNILSNSVKHNETDGLAVETTLTVNEQFVQVRIADNGTGVPEERRESIFRRGETTHAKDSGSGFGLFFVDAMVEKYNGQIWVEASDAGGACFVVELPRPEAQAETAVI
jgi:PAS domain S-box-containing protein